jgi:hypothetical protein
LKNILIGILIAVIIIGTGLGIKWEIESFNAEYNPTIDEQLKEFDDEEVNEQEKDLSIEDTINTSK